MATETSIIFSQQNLFTSTFTVFYDMKKMGLLTDVTIRIENRVFSVHRVILAAVIPYFRAMFTSILSESEENEISMKEFDSDALENIINFAYTNQIKITTENVQSLLVASEFLQLIEMRDICCDFLSKRLDPNNVMHVRSLADSLNCSSLIKNADSYIRSHFGDFCLAKDFINLPFPFLNELIRSDDLHITSEEKVYQAVMTWVKTDPSRHSVLPELLTGIRLTYLTPQFLIKKASRERLILESFRCRDLLDEAKHFHFLAEERPSSCSFSLKERCYHCMYLFCCSKSKGLTVLKYVSVTGKWNTILNDKTRHDVQHVIALGDEIYVFRSNNFETFNPLTLEWSPRKKLSGTVSPQRYAVPCCNLIYWFTDDSNLSSAVYFDPKQNEWFTHAQFVQFPGAELLSSGAEVYILGMLNNKVSQWDAHRRINKRYNPQAGTVSNIPQMSNNRNRICFGCAVLDDKVYVCGGSNDYNDWSGVVVPSEPLLSSAEVYSALDGHWRSISSMNTERKNFSLLSYDGKLYAFGGKGRNRTNISTIECYDPVTDTWTPAGSFSDEYDFVEPVVIFSPNK